MFSSNLGQLIGSLGATSISVLLILMGFSVFSWGIILYKWRMFRMIDTQEPRFLHIYQRGARLGDKQLFELRRVAKQLPHSPSGSIFLGIWSRVGHLLDHDVSDASPLPPKRNAWPGRETRKGSPWPERQYLEQVIRYLVQDQITRQEAYLPFLATTGNITPFIGLLGTVVGVINAFRQIGIEGTASIAAVAPGIAEALLATAAGLFAAIPAVIGYNYYLAKIRKTILGVEAFSLEFLNALEGIATDMKEVNVVR